MGSSIREFGVKIPVLARGDGEVVDGRLRPKAARKLGSWPGGDTTGIPYRRARSPLHGRGRNPIFDGVGALAPRLKFARSRWHFRRGRRRSGWPRRRRRSSALSRGCLPADPWRPARRASWRRLATARSANPRPPAPGPHSRPPRTARRCLRKKRGVDEIERRSILLKHAGPRGFVIFRPETFQCLSV